MRRRAAWRLLQHFLVFVVAVACDASGGNAADASTAAAKADSTTARPDSISTARHDSTSAQPDSVPTARPDSTTTRRDSTPTARPDSISTAPSESTSVVPADTSGAGTPVKPKGSSVLADTLQFLPPPGAQTGGEPKAGGAPEKPKERVGLFGLTPIVILFGIAAINYFIIKAVTH